MLVKRQSKKIDYDDTNIIQAEIFYMLSDRTYNICVVGDETLESKPSVVEKWN